MSLIQQQMLVYYPRCVFDKNKALSLGVCVCYVVCSAVNNIRTFTRYNQELQRNTGVKCKMLIDVENRFSSSQSLKECFIQDLRLIISWLICHLVCSPELYSRLINLYAQVLLTYFFNDHYSLLKSHCLPYSTAVSLNPVIPLVFGDPEWLRLVFLVGLHTLTEYSSVRR